MERELRDLLPGRKFDGVSPERSRIMRAIKGKNNKTTEQRFRLGLVRARVRGWRVRPKGILGNPDFIFPNQRIAVFIDGCFWHGCAVCGRVPKSNAAFWKAKFERNQAKDARANRFLEADGYKVVRLWEHQVKRSLQECIDDLRNLLRQS